MLKLRIPSPADSDIFLNRTIAGGEDLYQLHIHGHADGEEHPHGIRLPQDQRVLPGKARLGIPGTKYPPSSLELLHFLLIPYLQYFESQ